jgi:hypothetical protein
VSDVRAGGVRGDSVPGGSVLAPDLAETARIWFDSESVPAVSWDARARRFTLVEDGGSGPGALTLLERPHAVRDPDRVARVLAVGLAACDFPPNGDGASPHHVRATLRAHGLDPDDL